MLDLRHLCVVVVSILLVSRVTAQNQIDIGSSKDNTLFEDTTGVVSNGAGQNFFAGKNNQGSIRRGVLAFDIGGNVPSGITIDSVKLTLFMSQTSAGDEPVEIHRLLADWGEGTSVSTGGQGAPSTPGDATWIHTFYDTTFWTSVGGDFVPTVSASETVGGIGFYTWDSTPQMVADVQDWLDNPSSNFGWIALGNESANQTSKRFETKENIVPANRPLLSVFWTTPSSVDDHNNSLPQRFELGQNYPNPFNPTTIIDYQSPGDTHVTLRIYDLLGREIATLVEGYKKAGKYSARWNAMDDNGTAVTSGVYIYRIAAGEFTASRKMLFLK